MKELIFNLFDSNPPFHIVDRNLRTIDTQELIKWSVFLKIPIERISEMIYQ